MQRPGGWKVASEEGMDGNGQQEPANERSWRPRKGLGH